MRRFDFEQEWPEPELVPNAKQLRPHSTLTEDERRVLAVLHAFRGKKFVLNYLQYADLKIVDALCTRGYAHAHGNATLELTALGLHEVGLP